jgi:RNA polymerase sigma-70 factor (ECF subfamily)
MNDTKPPNPTTEIEQAWIAAARRGDADAFESLVRCYEKKVFALAVRLCGNADDAQEAAQEAFLSAWQGLPNFRGDAGFSTWLYRLTSNACMDLLRREKRHRVMAGPSLDDAELSLDVTDPGDGPQTSAERAELRREVERGLSELSAEYRTVLVLREIHQLSYDEIAETLRLDLGTVKSRISRGRRRLRDILEQSGNFFAAQPSKETETEGCK